MKKLLATVAILIGSCAPSRGGLPSAQEPHSVYKVYEVLSIDASPLCEGNAACLAKAAKPVVEGFVGTAWVLSNDGRRSVLMTAGHLCTTDKAYEYSVPQISVDSQGELSLTRRTFELPIVGTAYRAEAEDGTVIPGLSPVLVDHGQDLCALSVAQDLGEPLPVASGDPEYGQQCHVIEAPHGVWGGGVAPTTTMTFSGRGKQYDGYPIGLFFVGLGNNGSSGSPVICDGQVAGVLNLLDERFDDLFSAVPWDQVRKFQDRIPGG